MCIPVSTKISSGIKEARIIYAAQESLHDQVLIGSDEGIYRELGRSLSIDLLYAFHCNSRQAALADERDVNREEGTSVDSTDAENERASLALILSGDNWNGPSQ